MKYDKDKIKAELTIEQVFDFCANMGGEPKMDQSGEFFIMRTICHNPIGEGSHKLYYYNSTHLFYCYTSCGSFDIFQLYINTQKVAGVMLDLPQAVERIAAFFNLAPEIEKNFNDGESFADWKILQNYDKIQSVQNSNRKVELTFYNEKILENYPFVRYRDWEKEGITSQVMRAKEIRFDPAGEAMLIPHYNIEGKLVGIRSRTIVKEEEAYGKYRPSVLNGKMYNHPLGFNLYNLNWTKNNIAAAKMAIVYEGEKSALKSAAYFGQENDISVAVCGSTLTAYQVNLLLSLGVTEIVIAFDKQWKERGDDEFKHWTKKLTELYNKYGSKVEITFVFDKEGTHLGYKESPIDRGPDVFLKLFKERIRL